MTVDQMFAEFTAATAPLRENAIAKVHELATMPRVRHCGTCATCERCPECGGLIFDADEITGAHPWGTGYVLRACEDCGREVSREWRGH